MAGQVGETLKKNQQVPSQIKMKETVNQKSVISNSSANSNKIVVKSQSEIKNTKLAIANGIGRGKEEDATIILINNDGTMKVKLNESNKEVNASKGSGVQDIVLKNGDKVKVQVKGILVLVVEKI